ncbi:nucleoside transporter C-terminal domain-containing protein, partial [Staphylococcus aureus]|uniref:nucleoside transporter C-terminal domain-containing protein n=1 Tax=Staphylococcus aureus TaxID=1280 RepID=UPI00273148A9
SEHAKGVTSLFLVSFAHSRSIGLISGAINSLNDQNGYTVARFGLQLLFGATLVSFISPVIAGFFI